MLQLLIMQSYQNLILLQNLYRQKALGFEYTDHFNFNIKDYSSEANSIDELHQNISKCHLCDLSKSLTQSMSGYGNINADIMIIDYTVSQMQDSTNSYFTGRSGEVLKNMVENVLMCSIDDIYYTHAIKCKTLDSNRPSHSEFKSCKGYLFAQINFIKPKVIVTLGSEAYAKLTSDKENFNNIRGHIIDFQRYKLIPIYHPMHLLKNPELKKDTLSDLKTIKFLLK